LPQGSSTPTDTEEVLLEAVHPIILNGIEDMIGRPDLADRAIFLSLESISESRRQTERQLWSLFRQQCPQIRDALLSAARNSRNCRGWPILRSGLPLARERFGQPEILAMPTGSTAKAPTTISSKWICQPMRRGDS
jgi:hypothetical protein